MSRTRLRGIELAGSRVAIEVPAGLDWRWPGERYESFASSAEGAQVYVGVRVGSAPSVARRGFVYESQSHRFEVAERGDDWIVSIHGGDGLERTAVFNDAFSEGEVVLSPAAASLGVAPLAHPLDELLVLHRVVRAGGLVLRGSLVLNDERALAFLGTGAPAGGESAPHYWRKADTQRIAGERLVVLPSLEAVRTVGCPWIGIDGGARPFNARLDAVHSIRPSRAVFADRLDRDDAVGELLDHAVVPIHDPRCAERVFEAAAGLVDRVSLVRLGLPEEKRVIPFTWGRNDTALAFAPPFIT